MPVTIAMVALSGKSKVAGDAIPKAWAKRWPNGPQPKSLKKRDNTLSLDVGDHQVIYGLMPAPIPWSDLEEPCRQTVFWDNAVAEMRQHQRHAIVTVVGDGDLLGQMTVLTQATIAFLDASEGAVGVFWCNSLLVLPGNRFCEIACEFIPHAPVLPIWINFSIVQNADSSYGGFTRGLASLGHREFETKNSREPPAELRNRLLGLAAYVIEAGAVVKNGDTVGENSNEKIKVTYEQSSFGNEGEVMLLDYQVGEKNVMTTYGCLHTVFSLVFTIGFGYLIYTFLPILRGSFFRHIVFIPLTLICGVIFMQISDAILERMFGLKTVRQRKA